LWLHPWLGLDASFLEEPVMLLPFVLLGRALEARAKVGASALSCLSVQGVAGDIVRQATLLL
jgi:cation transport ATPase